MQQKEKKKIYIFEWMTFSPFTLPYICVCVHIQERVIVSLSLRPLFASTCKYRSYIIYLHVVSVDRWSSRNITFK